MLATSSQHDSLSGLKKSKDSSAEGYHLRKGPKTKISFDFASEQVEVAS